MMVKMVIMKYIYVCVGWGGQGPDCHVNDRGNKGKIEIEKRWKDLNQCVKSSSNKRGTLLIGDMNW